MDYSLTSLIASTSLVNKQDRNANLLKTLSNRNLNVDSTRNIDKNKNELKKQDTSINNGNSTNIPTKLTNHIANEQLVEVFDYKI